MKKCIMLSVTLLISALLISNACASITPDSIIATLHPSESVYEHKFVFLPGAIPKGDVIFAFDLTGSMGGTIDTAKTEAVNIMTALDALISDAQYGVMSFMDYPGTYDSYGYYAMYGDAGSGDYAYNLDQGITSDRTLVSNTINSLTLGWGADGPQDYTRIMFESYADANIGWRDGAKHILIIFGDSVPHDDDINEDVPGTSGTWSTGGDPGRDEIMFTADDLDLLNVLENMDHSYLHVTLLFVGWYYDQYWPYWTGITGGGAYSIDDPSEVPTAIQTLIGEEAAHVDTLTLEAEVGYEAWLASVVPPEYEDIDIPPEGITREFDITITVPLGTMPGIYDFHIIAVADGASYGEQRVRITVPLEEVIPEVPLGTILASTSMILGLLGYLFIPKAIRARKKL